jgi:hypothetical protein
MNKNKLVASIAGIVLSICLTTAVAQTETPPEAKRIFAELAKQRSNYWNSVNAQVEALRGNGGRRDISICQGIYHVDPENIEDDPHLTDADWFVLVGPLPFNQEYQVHTLSIGSYVPSWKPGTYRAVPDTSMTYGDPSRPEWFDLEPVPVKKAGKHEEERNHFYRMQITNWDNNGCPTYVFFHHDVHEGEITIPLHPGHAGANRD